MKTRFEHADPILSVSDMAVSVKYYVDVLGFRSADWGSDTFTSVNRDTAGIYLWLDASGISGLVVDNLSVTKLFPAASTQPLCCYE